MKLKGLRQRVLAIFIITLMTFTLLWSAAIPAMAATPVDTYDSVELSSTTLCAPSGIFSTYSVTNNGRSGDTLSLTLSMGLNDAAKESALDTAGIVLTGEDYDDMVMLDALADDTLPPITFTLNFAPGAKPAGLPSGAIESGSSFDPLGSFAWSGSDAAGYTLTGTFNKKAYIIMGVNFNMNFLLASTNSDGVGSGDIPVEWNDTDKFTVSFPAPTPPDTDSDSAYAISKQASYTPGSETITYTITATASDASADGLVGKTILDQLPDGLDFVSATGELTLDGPVTSDLGPLSASGNDFSYTFPASPANIREGIFTITARLSQAQMLAFMNNNGSGDANYSPTFTNNAQLQRTVDGHQQEVCSDSSQQAFSLPKFFTKNGTVSNVDHRIYNWEITVNTYGSASNAYIIDSLDPRIHDYLTTGGNKVMLGSTQLTVQDGGQLAAGVNYASLTTAALQSASPTTPSETLLAGLNSLAANTCIIYTTADDTQKVLIIPLKNANNNYLGAPHRITYSTRMQGTTSSSDSTNVKNDAKLVWKGYTYGPGNGYWEDKDFGYDIGKNYPANTQVVHKTAGSYTEATQQMVWNFAVNAYSTHLDKVIIEDKLYNHQQQFVLWQTPGTYPNITLNHINGTGDIDVPYVAPASFTENLTGYTFEEGSDAGGNYTIIKICINCNCATTPVPLADTDRYDFSLTTQVKDPNFLGKNYIGSQRFTLANSADVRAWLNGTPGPDVQTSYSTKVLNNAILSKAAPNNNANNYDYTKNTVGWTITLNQSRVPITTAKVQDTLPVGTSLYEGASASDEVVTIRLNDTTSYTATVQQLRDGYTVPTTSDVITLTDETSATTAEGYRQDAFSFAFTNASTGNVLQNRYDINFLTVFEKKYMLEKFLPTGSDAIVNTCAFTTPSAVHGQALTQSVNANRSLSLPPVAKEGTQGVVSSGPYTGTGMAAWDLVINRHGANMQGAVVRDDFSSKPYFELDCDSFVIEAATLNRVGAVAGSTPIADTSAFDLSLSGSGFQFTIPAAYSTTPLRVRFTTCFIDSISNKNMVSNEASVTLPGGDVLSTGTAIPANAAAYVFNSSATGHMAPRLTITKATSTANSSGDPCLTLGDAKYELQEMTFDGDDWVEKSNTAKERITLSGGVAAFMFLKQDTLYKLVETEAPKGYIASTQPMYFWLGTGSAPATLNGIAVQQFTTTNASGTYIGALTLLNTPSTNVGIHMQTADGKPMKNIEFTLTGVVNGHTVTHTVQSGSDGKLLFEGLDPGISYTLTRTTTLENCVADEQWTVDVQWNSVTNSTKVTMTEAGGAGGQQVLPNADGYHTLTASYTTGTLTLNGVSQELGQNIPQDGAIFTIYNDAGDKVGYLVWDAASQQYLPSTMDDPNLAATPNGASFLQPAGAGTQLGLIPGNYTYQLTTPPVGFLPNNNVFSFSVPAAGGAVTLPGTQGNLFVFNRVSSTGNDDAYTINIKAGPPKTGDSSNPLPYTCLMLSSILLLGVLTWRLRADKLKYRTAK